MPLREAEGGLVEHRPLHPQPLAEVLPGRPRLAVKVAGDADKRTRLRRCRVIVANRGAELGEGPLLHRPTPGRLSLDQVRQPEGVEVAVKDPVVAAVNILVDRQGPLQVPRRLDELSLLEQ